MRALAGYLIVLVSLAFLLGSHNAVFATQEASSIMCDNGIVNIGDSAAAVQDKCGEPSTKNYNSWVYNFGPDEPVYTVIFDQGQVVRILEDEWGS
jgi:hypothetical protein